MAETSWEAQSRRKTRFWKWSVIILLAVLVAGIIIHNNRDVVSGADEPSEEGDSFSMAVDSGAVSASAPATKDHAPAGEHRTEVHAINTVAAESHADPDVPAAAPNPERKDFYSIASGRTAGIPSAIDSVEVGEVPCVVSNRKDIVVRIALVVYCDKAKKSEVLFKRDALAVVIRNTIRSRDLESIRFDAIEPELITAMNLVFDTRTIADIALRSVKIEKASYE